MKFRPQACHVGIHAEVKAGFSTGLRVLSRADEIGWLLAKLPLLEQQSRNQSSRLNGSGGQP